MNKNEKSKLDLKKLHDIAVLQLTAPPPADAAMIRLIGELMRSANGWTGLEQRKAVHQLAKEKYRDWRKAEEETRAHEQRRAREGGGIRPETLAEIERELRLM